MTHTNWGKQIHFGRFHALITNHLRLGLSVKIVKRESFDDYEYHKFMIINFFTNQIEIDL